MYSCSHDTMMLFSPVPFIIFALLFCLLVVTQIQGHAAGSSPPSPRRTVRALHSHRENSSALFFPSRLSSTCAYPHYDRRSHQQLQSFEKKSSIWRFEPIYINASSVRGQPLDYRGDRIIYNMARVFNARRLTSSLPFKIIFLLFNG